MPENNRFAKELARCLRFIEDWYSCRKLPYNEIMAEFDFERSTIAGYLTPHINRKIVNIALDQYKSEILQLNTI